MKIVTPILKRMVYPSLARTGCLRWLSPAGLAVVTYHGVFPDGYDAIDPALDGNLVSARRLRRQLQSLKADYDVISPEDALAWRLGQGGLPARAVLLTCDDGLLNNLTEMLPVLREEGLRCLFFVTGASAEKKRSTLWYEDLLLLLLKAPAGRLEICGEQITIRGKLGLRAQRQTIWWNAVKQLSEITAEARDSFLWTARRQLGLEEIKIDENSTWCRRFGLLTVPELRQLAAAGMTIGAHTMSHPMLSHMPAELARAEVADCRAELEAALQTEIWAFAYPFGDAESVTPEVLAIPKQVGYQAAFVNVGGGLGTDLSPFALPRVHVTAAMSPAEFEAHVSGFYARLHRHRGGVAPALESARG